ncbi:MAG TPA: hypothetical protein VFI95_10640 [Terriglobales bacterium]|nr:hypothetical protein [Terriglobales bacterium]
MPNPRKVTFALVLLGLIAAVIWEPDLVAGFLHNALALSNVALLVLAIAALAWFLYWVVLRRILRARRIANARMRRMLRESTDRERE